VLENDRARVFKVDVTGLHSTAVDYRGHDYVIISPGKGNLEIAGSGIRYPMPMEDGEMQVLKSWGFAPHYQSLRRSSPSHRARVMREIHPAGQPVALPDTPAATEFLVGTRLAPTTRTPYLKWIR
jgi:hypothetical protein